MKKILIGWFLLYAFIGAFEINTHQALTRCAINGCLGNGVADNLYDFVKHAEIRYKSYSNEIFEGYSETYRKYANDRVGFGKWNILIPNSNFLGMIEAGSVLEDALYPSYDLSGDGRFNNHFYAA